MADITRPEMIKILNSIKGAKPITFEFDSPPTMRATSKEDGKSNPYKNDITKKRRYNCMINFDYGNSVNRQRAREYKEENFKAGETWGGHTGDNRVLIDHNGHLYVQCKLERVVEQHFEKISTGAMVDPAALAEFFSDRSASNGQGVERTIKVIRIKATNITAFTHNKIRYEIVD